MNTVTVIQGNEPIILCQPHSGTFIPDNILENLNAVGRKLLDTDWHIPSLYEGLIENVTVIRANFSRYVIDANRDPNGVSLYPGQNTTSLVPNTTFDDEPIWIKPITDGDIAARLNSFHLPYHQSIEAEIARVSAIHGAAFVYDCHSIRSQIPFLFNNQLPDLNIGDNNGTTCPLDITQAVALICDAHLAYRYVVNGRFKGGWTTRHYGDPTNLVHAVQMELAQSTYMLEQAPWTYLPEIAEKVRPHLQEILAALSELEMQ